MSPSLTAALLLVASNLFMTLAWYGHLKVAAAPLWLAVLASWGIAFFEYALQVPANRIGAADLSLAQLKTLQEVISLAVFVLVNWALFGSAPTLSTLGGFVLIAAGAGLIFAGR